MKSSLLLSFLVLAAAVAGGFIYWALRGEMGKPPAGPQESVPPMTLPDLVKLVEAKRGLKFTPPLTFQAVAKQEISALWLAEAARLCPDVQANLRVRAWKMLGFRWEPPTEFGACLAGLLEDNFGCFLDREKRTLFYDPESNLATNPGLESRWLTGLATWLVEEHHPLGPLQGERRDDDVLLARAVLVAADAQDTAVGCMVDLPNVNPPVRFVPDSVLPTYAAPRFYREWFLFPSMIAPSYMQVRRGKTKEIDSLYINPPLSTTEILHAGTPQEAPLLITAPASPIAGRQPIWENVLGEFGILLLLKSQLQDDVATPASAGWRGDRYFLYGSGPSGEAGVSNQKDDLVWISKWGSPKDAREFADAAGGALLSSQGQPDSPEFHAADGLWKVDVPSRGFYLRVLPKGNSVILIRSGSLAFVESASASIEP